MASSDSKETVLLRNPAPKYSFQGRKLPKSSDVLTTEPAGAATPIKPNSVSGKTADLKLQHKPVAVVGASVQSNVSSPATLKQDFAVSASNTSQSQSLLVKPNLAVADGKHGNSSTATKNSPSQAGATDSSSFKPQGGDVLALPTNNGVSTTDASQSSVLPVGTEGGAPKASSASLEQRLQFVQEERDKLRAELNAQIQVNTELKRLLVASVGDDLYQRVENLCRDRAQLELDIGGFSKKMTEDYENIDKISIQADMWRSKYLASRVMTEELSSAKAYFALQCHDSHSALHQLLNERHELRTNLVESYKVLQQVKNAFDPLNTHRSSSLRSTNILDLAHTCQQLVEAVRFRLLPSNVTINVSADVSEQAWHDSLTRAESFAHEILSRPVEPGDPQPREGATYRSASLGQLSRYHPAVRYENLTINCCTHCKGELQVI